MELDTHFLIVEVLVLDSRVLFFFSSSWRDFPYKNSLCSLVAYFALFACYFLLSIVIISGSYYILAN